jgi:hypothetical protein
MRVFVKVLVKFCVKTSLLLLVADGRSIVISHYENDSSRGKQSEASAAIDATRLWIISLNNLENQGQFSKSHVTWIQKSFKSQILPHKP